MNNRLRNRIMVVLLIVEVVAVVLIFARVAMVCCTPLPPAELIADSSIPVNQTTLALLYATQTAASAIDIAPTVTSTSIPYTAVISPTTLPIKSTSTLFLVPSQTPDILPQQTETATTKSQIAIVPTLVATSSATYTFTPTEISSLSPTLLPPTALPPTISAPMIVSVVILPTIPIPTAVPTATKLPTARPTATRLPTKPPTATASPTEVPTETPSLTSTTILITATRLVPSATAVPPTATSKPCGWAWATSPLPEVTDAAQSAIINAGLNTVTVTAQAYGETCSDGNGSSHGFSAMTTDFYLNVPVSDFNDVDTMASIVKTAYNTLSTLTIKLPAALGLIDIKFSTGNQFKHFRASFTQVYTAINAGKNGAELLAVGGL